LSYQSSLLRRPLADVYGWAIEHRLPVTPIPLSGDDSPITIDLQSALDLGFARAGYDYSLNYAADLQPLPSDTQAEWMRSILNQSDFV